MAEISKKNIVDKASEKSNDSNDEKATNLAMFCHLSSPIGFLFFQVPNLDWMFIPIWNWLPPLLIWLILRNKDNSIVIHAKKVLNFQVCFSMIIIMYQTLCLFLFGGFASYFYFKGNLEAVSNLKLEEIVDINSIITNIHLIMDTSPSLFYVLAILIIGVLGHIFLWIASFVCTFIAAVQAKKGKIFNYPFSLEIFK